MKADKFKLLIQKYQNGELTGKQKELLDQWFDELGKTDASSWTPAQLKALESKTLNQIQENTFRINPRRQSLRRWLPYAAALLVFTISGIAYYTESIHKAMQSQSPTAVKQDITPGGNRATLTLADGRIVNLSETQSGIVIGEKITYTDGNSVLDNENSYESRAFDASSSLSLSTPKGGTYHVILADGTTIWLNSASTLRYPPRFGNDKRIVELEGEAYFEVAASLPSVPRPFFVKTKAQTVEVLGTHFNIAAYGDEEETKTTLVEGAVQIVNLKTNSVNRLKPGEQGIVSDTKTKVRNVNPEMVVAWKSGIFHFEDTPFEQMMKQIDRWYDIEVSYQGQIPSELFTGKMSRKVNLQVFVNFLKDSGIQSHIEGRRLIVDKQNPINN